MKHRLIVALDYSDIKSALDLVDELGDDVIFYKVGMELYYACGNKIIYELKNRNKKIFLDLKLHDIPNTVKKSIKNFAKLGVDIITIHGLGGYTMLKEAKESIIKEAKTLNIKPPKIIAITVLTSMSSLQWKELGFKSHIEKTVENIALISKRAGIDGIVLSPQELKFIKESINNNFKEDLKDFIFITPGIRMDDSNIGDQSRITTPKVAIKNGANFLVVGRPITKAANKKESIKNIITNMEEAYEE